MKFSQTFKIHQDQNTNENLIFIQDIYANLTRNGDNIVKYNLKRALNTFQGGSRTFLGEDCATVLSVFKYLCQHNSKNSCKKILEIIEQELVCGQSTSQTTSLELYKLIAKTQILRTSTLFETLIINENNIPTLLVNYKQHFNESEWKRICWFENDFSKLVQFKDLSYEDIVDLKFSRFQSLLSLAECCKDWSRSSQVQIRKNILRYKAFERDCEIRIKAGQFHIVSVIDNDIKSLLEIYCPDSLETAVSFDVTDSKEKNCIWAVFVQTSPLETDLDLLCTRVFYNLKRRHNVYLEKVSLIYSHHLTEYATTDGKISRFCVRDALETKQFDSKSTLWLANAHIDGTIDTDELDNLCESCFSGIYSKPLTIDNFDIVHEWYIELPVEWQIIFECFINQSTIKKSKTPEDTVRRKLEKLYIVFDTLLNIYNRNYIGVFQINNAHKLLIEYKSIGSVFDVTSATGATSSLSHAEIQLKKDADLDLCYYNTYLKEHTLEYFSTNGNLKSSVNLRSCHLILMLDNLVRLQYISDPNPGEHRSNQLCTLPITLQGLPADSEVTDTWHLADCDGRLNCICKHPVKLQDNEISRILLELCKSEKDAQDNFFNLMTFGNHILWKNLPDDLLEQVEEHQIDENNKNHDLIKRPVSSQEDDVFVDDHSDQRASEIDEDLVAVRVN